MYLCTYVCMYILPRGVAQRMATLGLPPTRGNVLLGRRKGQEELREVPSTWRTWLFLYLAGFGRLEILYRYGPVSTSYPSVYR